MEILQSPIEKEQIIKRIEDIICIHNKGNAKVPTLIIDKTLMNTACSLLDSILKGDDHNTDLFSRMDYCLFTCESFFECDEIIEIICDIYLFCFLQSGKPENYFKKFNMTVSRLRDQQPGVWKSYLFCLVNGETGYFEFANELFQNVVDVTRVCEIESDFSSDIQLASLILKTALYFTVNGKKICRLMFEMGKYIREDFQDEFREICIKEVYNNYGESSFTIASDYNNAKDSFQRLLAQQIIDNRVREQELQQKSRSIPDLLPSMERYQVFRVALQERNEKLNNSAKEASVLYKLFNNETLKYGKRTGFVCKGANGESGFQVSPIISIKQEYELPYLFVVSPCDWKNQRIGVVKSRSEYIALHSKELSPDTERKR